MLLAAVSRVVRFCTRYPWLVIVAVLALTVASSVYAATHFAINTDITKLISPDLAWRQRDKAFEKEFPGHFASTLVVVDAPTPELVSAATGELVKRLDGHPDLFEAVEDLAGGSFFARNGLMFQPTQQVIQLTQGLGTAAPLIDVLHGDPSLRGLLSGLNLGLAGVVQNKLTLDQMTRPMNMAADTLDDVFAGKPATFSWQEMLSGGKPPASQLRRFIEVDPVLDFTSLQPGQKADSAIRQTVAELHLKERFQARVRLTGTVPMGDEEFSTVQEGAGVNIIGTVVIVLIILWLALNSKRIISAVFINLFAGLAITAALGLMMVGALNMISVAFAVLFVGLGVDFAIQFCVRYRAERYECPDLKESLGRTATEIGVPLTLAAAAVAAGFLSFLPTDYRGLSELGQIAGLGMLIAYATSITLLPALITVMNPVGEPEPVGYAALAPVDDFLQRHRIGVVAGTVAVALLGLPLLYWLSFDFDPIHLRSPKVESVATLLDVQRDAGVGVNAVNVVAPNLAEAEKIAAHLKTMPQVDRVMTLQGFIPDDQPQKLAAIRDLDGKLGKILRSPPDEDKPTDAENVEALNKTAARLKQIAGNAGGQGADAARRLSERLSKLAQGDAGLRQRAADAFIVPLQVALGELAGFLQAGPVTADNVPDALKRQWIAADGKARVQAVPKGNPDDTDVLRKFAQTMLDAYPDAIGGPISILESGKTIVSAFVHAGIFALLSIGLILWIVLRRIGDVLLTLVPLLLAGVVTLELCVLIGMPLNFANIIALPLLLGVGVAFKIYYIMAWRAGQTNLLQSSLTRAVIWSALTTATAFGSLWLSSHPGTSSMGKLLALSLFCTLGAAVLFQPALMGKPRNGGGEGSAPADP
jgi:hopanoid biosynthesis associated RND transporter like protein HpnN